MIATDAKAKILRLLDEIAAGSEVEITKHGRTVARLVPARGPHALKERMAGTAMAMRGSGWEGDLDELRGGYQRSA